MKKSLFVIVSVLLSSVVFAHSGHTPFEMMSMIEGIQHQFNSPYHITVMLMLSAALIISAIIVSKKQQILKAFLMVLGFVSTLLSVSLLLA